MLTIERDSANLWRIHCVEISAGGATMRLRFRPSVSFLILASAIATSSAYGADPGPGGASFDHRWVTTFATDVRYFSWTSTRGQPTNANANPGRGHQIYVPVAAQVAGRLSPDFKTEFLIRGGWVHAHQTTAGLSGSVDTVTDTVTTARFSYTGWTGFHPFVAVSANLPTGLSSLSGTQPFARMDSDLVEIGSFGEGFNVGPTVGFNLPLTPQFIVTASAGYTWRSAYDRERSLSEKATAPPIPTEVSPGDVLTGTVTVAYADDTWSAKLTGSVSEETKTVENARPLYKPGRRYVASGSVSFNWPQDMGVTSVNASYSHSEKNEVLFLGAAALIKELMNANSDLYRVGIQHLIAWDRINIGPTGSFLYRDKNGYDQMTLQFVPAKTRWAAGLLMRYAPTDQITLSLRADRVWTREDERLAQGGVLFSVLANAFVPGSAVPIVSSDGWQIAGGANISF